MSYEGDISDMHDAAAAVVGASADEAVGASNASNVPKHGFGLADSADPATAAAVNGVELPNIITHPSPAEGEVAAPVALAAALAQNQAALDGRPLDGTDSTNGTPRAAAGGLPMVAASPTAHAKVCSCILFPAEMLCWGFVPTETFVSYNILCVSHVSSPSIDIAHGWCHGGKKVQGKKDQCQGQAEAEASHEVQRSWAR